MPHLPYSKIKVLIIGYGSIGKRHHRILSALGCRVKIFSRRLEAGDYQDLDEALDDNFHLIVIANETSVHAKTLIKIQSKNFKGHIFIEKPLSIRLEDIREIIDHDRIWIGYNLRFHPLIHRLKESLIKQKTPVYYAHFHVGQALSTWRQDRHSLETYSAIKALGGGVVHDLSHEIDLAQWLFGSWSSVKSFVNKSSDQTVDSDDLAIILAKGDSGTLISINMNYLDTMPTRFIQISSKDVNIKVDFIESIISINNENDNFPDGINQSYLKMWEEMLGVCIGLPRHYLCNFQEGVRAIQSIDEIYSNAA